MFTENLNEAKIELLAGLKSESEQELQLAVENFANSIQERILKEAKNQASIDMQDQMILSSRGHRSLTSEELKFYNEVIEGEGFAGTERLVPPTVYTSVFEYLTREHKLLSKIDFVNAVPQSKWILKKGDVNPAFWGKLNDPIKKKIDDGFYTVDTGVYKITAYLPVSKDMLYFGPEWLDRYVRTVLIEATAITLEDGIVNGDGNITPIGMQCDLEGPVINGTYTKKEKIPLDNFEPSTMYKEIIYPLTWDGKRIIDKVTILCNPADYYLKFAPETTILAANGVYVKDVLPVNAEFVETVALEQGTVIAGLPRDYWACLGSDRKIEVAKEVRIIEDEDLYLVKQYANGMPKSNNSFFVFDVTNFEPKNQKLAATKLK